MSHEGGGDFLPVGRDHRVGATCGGHVMIRQYEAIGSENDAAARATAGARLSLAAVFIRLACQPCPALSLYLGQLCVLQFLGQAVAEFGILLVIGVEASRDVGPEVGLACILRHPLATRVEDG